MTAEPKPASKTEPSADPELAALQREWNRQKLLADISEQKRKALTQSLPPSEAKPLEGKTTVDANAVIEAEILAYGAVATVAKALAEKVNDPKVNAPILIYYDKDITAVMALEAYLAQLKQLQNAYEHLPEAVKSGQAELALELGVATAVIKTAVDLLALFRVDTVVAGVQMTTDDLSLASAVGGILAQSGRKVYLTQLIPPVRTGNLVAESLDSARKAAVAAAARVAKLSDGDDKTLATMRLKQLDEVRRSYEDLLTHLAADGTSALANLIRGEAISEILANKDARIVFLKMVRIGGANITRQSLFHSKLTFSGGVIVNCIVFKPDRTILWSDTLHSYSGEFCKVPPTFRIAPPKTPQDATRPTASIAIATSAAP